MHKENKLYRSLFIASVLLLLINDLYLKYEFHNYLTGKISDFAGLFSLPYFLSSFLPKWKKIIYLLTGILFVIWKSELSQPILDFSHSYLIGINRVVDYSDFIALLILPASYQYWKSKNRIVFKPHGFLKPILIGTCCTSFLATSLPEKRGEFLMKSDYIENVSNDYELVKHSLHIYESDENQQHIYTIKIPEKRAEILISIKVNEQKNKTTNIAIDSILSYRVQGNGLIFFSGINEDDVKYVKKLNKKEIESLFSEQIRKQFKEK